MLHTESPTPLSYGPARLDAPNNTLPNAVQCASAIEDKAPRAGQGGKTTASPGTLLVLALLVCKTFSRPAGRRESALRYLGTLSAP
jgi:hypothetical protein